MTSRRLSDLDMLAGLADDDILYVVRPGEPIEDRSRQIIVQNIRAYLAGISGMIVRDVQVTTNGNIRVIGQAADGTAIDVTLSVPGTTTPMQEIHYALGTVWSTANSRLEGNRGFGDVDEITRGNVLVFNVPLDRPLATTPATLSVSGIATIFAIQDAGGTAVTIGELTPGRLYWGVVDTIGLLLMNIIGEPDIVRTFQQTITNAELKTLDTDYIQLLPAPGVGKFIQVNQAFVRKNGDDVPPERDYAVYVAISPDTALSAAEIVAGTSDGVIPTWAAGDRYLFVGRSITDAPLERAHVRAGDSSVYADDLPMTALPGTMPVPGAPAAVWWYRSDAVVPQSVSGGRVTYIRQSVPTMARLYGYAQLLVMFVGDPSLALPLHSDDPYTAATGYLLVPLLQQADGYTGANAIGGHGLLENQALQFGILIGDRRRYRATRGWTSETWDTLIGPVDDVSFDIRLNYQIHDFPTIV